MIPDRILPFRVVADAPGRPQDVRVLEAASRQVKLTWLSPPDDRSAASYSPALQYSVQWQPKAAASGEGEPWRSRPAVAELRAVVADLSPATVYRFRVVAENELGAGEPSEAVTVRTDSEAPAGEPKGLTVTATASDALAVSWSAPPVQTWHGDILGYYVGYREHGLGRPGGQGHNFSTVTARPDGSGSATLTGLKKYRKYGVVVQAFNEKGPGPMSEEEVAQTLEDGEDNDVWVSLPAELERMTCMCTIAAPGAPPQDVRCQSRAPQSLAVEWQPPPLLQQHGVLQGYRVYYENVEEWPPGIRLALFQETLLLAIRLRCPLSCYLGSFFQAPSRRTRRWSLTPALNSTACNALPTTASGCGPSPGRATAFAPSPSTASRRRTVKTAVQQDLQT